ncbi:MAG: hypothetical protein PW789_01965 [Edaphobacter sp.]|uniref:hypothetical protein n=1 Tax=Edaphobacter sp. TaxID=1934404 RepID=UPI002393CE1C|nr:hypothetical protein [Edaphobacter sp.]MDE1175354.1 hypothetical protein [Edaphobacter sp.]
MTIAASILRFFWFRMPLWAERILLATAVSATLVRLFFFVSHWGTVSLRFNAAFCWVAVIGYELMLVRFSLMRPRWLTCICAVILFLPMFASALLVPLTAIFDTEQPDLKQIGKNYLLLVNPWDEQLDGHTGHDLIVMYQPSWAPFLQHGVQRASFSDDQCRSQETQVTVDRAKKQVSFHCPGLHGERDAIAMTLPIK